MSLLGIDVGTSGVKCVAYNEVGVLLAQTYREYDLLTPEPGIVELDPNVVWHNLCLNIEELNAREAVKRDPICALSISASGNEALPVDKSGNALDNVIMSMDKRGSHENDRMNSLLGGKRIYEITGQPPSPLYPLNRLLWLQQHKPDVFEKTHKFLCWEDYLLLKLGAEPVTDYSIAGGTLAFDIQKKMWSDEILRRANIDRALFPTAYPSGTNVGNAARGIADALGFSGKVILATGGWDQTCAALGAGITKSGSAAVGTGTMEVMQVCVAEPKTDEKMLQSGYPFCNHAVGDLYICLSINYCAGALLKWYRDQFAYQEKAIAEKERKNVYDVIMESTQKSKSPVIFLPYFEGAQTPRNNPDASGAILSMSLRTTREDIVKGMLESLNYDLRLNVEKIEEACGISIDELPATGGGARSDIWMQMKADITGKTILRLDGDEAGCLATAVLAGHAAKKFDSVEATIDQWVKVVREFQPDMEQHERYKDRYQHFLDAYSYLYRG